MTDEEEAYQEYLSGPETGFRLTFSAWRDMRNLQKETNGMTSEETTTTKVACAYCKTEVLESTVERYMVKAMGRKKKPFREREGVYHQLCPTCYESTKQMQALVEELTKK